MYETNGRQKSEMLIRPMILGGVFKNQGAKNFCLKNKSKNKKVEL